jgi:hypothetical protein
LSITKGLTLQGGGTYAVSSAYADNGTWPLHITFSGLASGASGISIANTTAGSFVRVTGINFTGTTEGGLGGTGAISIGSTNRADFRVDNCKFNVSGNILAHNASYYGGLVDHIYAERNTCDESNTITAHDFSGDDYGDAAFTNAVDFGSSHFLFVEDSVFKKTGCTDGTNSTYCMDAQAGGRYVFRNNYVYDQMVVWHGTETGAPQRGGYVFEIYDNEFEFSLYPEWPYHTAVYCRGGTCLVYDNSFSGYGALWKTGVKRSHTSYARYGSADGTKDWDGNWGGDYPTGYPVLDQPGRGTCASSTLADVQPQQESKCHLWGNTLTNTGGPTHNDADYVVDGRDYEYNTGASATLAGYTAYTYPHPLQSGSEEATTYVMILT